MNQRRVIYLERDFEDDLLKFPNTSDDIRSYSLGDLYIGTNSHYLRNEYDIRYYRGERFGYDKLKKILQLNEGLYIYRLAYESSKLPEFPPINFVVERTIEQSELFPFLWIIREIDQTSLDLLFDEYGYNLVGNTNMPDDK